MEVKYWTLQNVDMFRFFCNQYFTKEQINLDQGSNGYIISQSQFNLYIINQADFEKYILCLFSRRYINLKMPKPISPCI